MHVARLSVVTNDSFSLGGSSLPIGKQDVIAGDNHPRIAAPDRLTPTEFQLGRPVF
jgi:hypothetical protein